MPPYINSYYYQQPTPMKFDSVRSNSQRLLDGNFVAERMGEGGSYKRALLESYIPIAGKWYIEFEIELYVGSGDGMGVGIVPLANMNYNITQQIGGYTYDVGYLANGNIYSGVPQAAYGATWGTGDIIGIIFDSDALTIEFSKNNIRYGTTSGQYVPQLADRPFVVGIHNYNSGDRIRIRTSATQQYKPTGYTYLTL